ncbi:4-hydroxy-2-oxoheptanedioate aldolase [Rhodoligotrophos appendicifer]|uniref:HpcH/HpaI aldolase family protein n=1 Tax=Rhodoligotrophos appendicifer TaxID=987056 RepID=UPI001186135A|nr:aldolase/citrate lyase family protein [Rhodoligotrophos appendicifer]
MLCDRLKTDELLLSSWSTVPDSIIAEALALDKWDACTIDMQHGMMGYAEARSMVMAIAGAGKPSVVRLPLNGLSIGARMLDIGVSALIAPMINSAAEAEQFVQAFHFPPHGGRSWGAYRAVATGRMTKEAYLAEAGARIALFAMIETREALDNVEAIAAIRGLGGLFVGPSDLTISLTNGRSFEPDGEAEAVEALEHIVAVARKHGLSPGIFTPSAAQAKTRIAQGFRFVTVNSDIGFLNAGSAAALNALGRA